MTTCACPIDMNINICDDNCITVEKEGFEKATEDTECYECGKIINQGGIIYVEEISPMDDEQPKYINTIRTCPACLSIRRELFCSFCYGRLMQDLEDYLIENDGHIPEDCMVGLIPEAQKTVLSMMDEYLEDENW